MLFPNSEGSQKDWSNICSFSCGDTNPLRQPPECLLCSAALCWWLQVIKRDKKERKYQLIRQSSNRLLSCCLVSSWFTFFPPDSLICELINALFNLRTTLWLFDLFWLQLSGKLRLCYRQICWHAWTQWTSRCERFQLHWGSTRGCLSISDPVAGPRQIDK